MKLEMLTKEDVVPMKVKFSEILEDQPLEEVILIIEDVNDDLQIDAEFNENVFTSDQVQELTNEFFKGLVESLKKGEIGVE